MRTQKDESLKKAIVELFLAQENDIVEVSDDAGVMFSLPVCGCVVYMEHGGYVWQRYIPANGPGCLMDDTAHRIADGRHLLQTEK